MTTELREAKLISRHKRDARAHARMTGHDTYDTDAGWGCSKAGCKRYIDRK